jgi:hypothetical protein
VSLVEIQRYSTKVEADLARLLLQSEGLDAVLFDDGLNHALGAFMPVRLMVLDSDADEALQILTEDRQL